ncbi:piercer of microtubule wall 2 protein-like isoform X1 [Saccoglossus kowalevskii]|uniref:UPF0691 protein C9orf116 homolog isoform 1 n=1 Tax=Saccoglossus kowalevskii TaxID=10224 RepID=A0ABM0H012_SACKO|nr:PREDICTED: UPF0691 protein C9orf116 homolog isoform 1 [Saccoglossus kowalevskii]
MAGAENKLTLPHEVIDDSQYPQERTGEQACDTNAASLTENMPPCASPGNPIFSCMERPTIEAPQQSDEGWFEGYGTKSQHPMYRTTNSKYGSMPPSVHTMPTSFHARSQKFSEPLGKCGMYRNKGLNTGMDQSKV